MQELSFLLKLWRRANLAATLGLSPLDLRIAPNRIVQPDLFVICEPVSTTMPIDAVPDLIIEVVSTNRSYDRLAKRFVYEQAGVREYWMVDIERRCIEVVVGGELRQETERVQSGALDGFDVDIVALFECLAND